MKKEVHNISLNEKKEVEETRGVLFEHLSINFYLEKFILYK